jgi:hypothetical protein
MGKLEWDEAFTTTRPRVPFRDLPVDTSVWSLAFRRDAASIAEIAVASVARKRQHRHHGSDTKNCCRDSQDLARKDIIDRFGPAVTCPRPAGPYRRRRVT